MSNTIDRLRERFSKKVEEETEQEADRLTDEENEVMEFRERLKQIIWPYGRQPEDVMDAKQILDQAEQERMQERLAREGKPTKKRRAKK